MVDTRELDQACTSAVSQEWSLESIGENALRVGSGITPTGGRTVYRATGRPFIRSQNVGAGKLLLGDMAYIDESTHATFAETELKQGDVLLNITGASIGRSAVADERVSGGNVNQHVCIIRPDRSKVDPRFLSLFLLSTNGQRQINSFQAGGSRQGLNFEQVRSIRFPRPPLPQQGAIAAAASDAEALLESLDRLIAKKRDLKQAVMQQLLTGRIRLPGFESDHGFKSTDLGRVPNDWTMDHLRKHLSQSPTYGVVKAGVFQRVGIPMIRGGDIRNGEVTGDQPFITAEKSTEYGRTVLRQGDVIIALVGYPGESAVIPRRLAGANISRAVGLLRTAATLLPEFLVCYLNSPEGRREFLRPCAGSAQEVVNLAALGGLAIPLPSIPEQRGIVDVLSDTESEIATLEAERQKSRNLKRAMTENLLTGKTRLLARELTHA